LEHRLLDPLRQLAALRRQLALALLLLLLLAVDKEVERVALVAQLPPRAVHVGGVRDGLVESLAELRQHLLKALVEQRHRSPLGDTDRGAEAITKEASPRYPRPRDLSNRVGPQSPRRRRGGGGFT